MEPREIAKALHADLKSGKLAKINIDIIRDRIKEVRPDKAGDDRFEENVTRQVVMQTM